MVKIKHSKDEPPNPNTITNREVFQRLNFLYQASAYLKGIEASVSAPLEVEHPCRGSVQKKRRQATLGELGSSYVRCMRTIGNKSVIRIDPSIKRTFCKGCDTVLSPGRTAIVRVRGSAHKGRNMVYTCLACHTSRNIPAPPVTLSPVLGPSSTSPTAAAPSSLQTTLEALQASPSSQTEIPVSRPNKRKRFTPHHLPLFARPDAGHILFRGNEVLCEHKLS